MWTIISDEASVGVSSDVDYMEQLFWLMINKIQETCHLSTGFSDSSTRAVLTAEPAARRPMLGGGVVCHGGSLNRTLCPRPPG